MVQAVSQGAPVMVTWANWHYVDFVRNWVAHVRAIGVRSYLVGAMDDQILQVSYIYLLEEGVSSSCDLVSCKGARVLRRPYVVAVKRGAKEDQILQVRGT